MRLHLILVLPLLACDAEFSVARGDLGPFRIAALGVQTSATGARVASAAVYSGLGLYHEEAPALAWTLDGAALGEGFDVEVPDGDLLGLTATAPDGTALSATVHVADPPPALGLSRGAVDLGDDLSLATRQAATATPVDTTAAEGQAMRLSLGWESAAADADWTTFWMLAEGRGTLLEEDTYAADLFAEEITFDDGLVETRQPLEPGLLSGLALVGDGAGSNQWLWFDGAVGLDLPALRHRGRLLPLAQADGADVAAAAAQAGYARATLVADGSVAGVGLQDVSVPITLDLAEQDVLGCAVPGVPFELSWLAEGRCTLGEVDGATVLLEVW